MSAVGLTKGYVNRMYVCENGETRTFQIVGEWYITVGHINYFADVFRLHLSFDEGKLIPLKRSFLCAL
jgi:hypothetical protein